MKKIKTFDDFINENSNSQQELEINESEFYQDFTKKMSDEQKDLKIKINKLEDKRQIYYNELIPFWMMYHDNKCELKKDHITAFKNDLDLDFDFEGTLVDDMVSLIDRNKINNYESIDKIVLLLDRIENLNNKIIPLVNDYMKFFPEITKNNII